MIIIVSKGKIYKGIQGYLVKKFGSITIFITTLHLIEDSILIGLGRYTEVNFLFLLLGTLLLSVIIAWIARIQKVREWLGKD